MAADDGRPTIVHISADYPDTIKHAKTRAIAALVEGTREQYDHRVYSLNRSGGLRAWLAPGTVEPAADEGTVAAWRYRAPARGLFLARAMDEVARQIAIDLRDKGLAPALVCGHKLSVEGIAAYRLAGALRVPFAVTLQGNSDQKIIGVRPDLRPLFHAVWQNAAAVVAFAPWIATWCSDRLGPRARAPEAIPCVPVRDALLAPRPAGDRVITAFNLDDWRNKNVARLIAAVARLRQSRRDLTLEIAGDGSCDSINQIDRMIAASQAAPFIRRIGPVDPSQIQTWMNGAAVFAMPSHRESFGMVFAEAVLAGCPIVYPRGAAVDGYFDQAHFARAVAAGDVAGIAMAIGDLLSGQAEAKAALLAWQSDGFAEAFRSEQILRRYRHVLQAAFADGNSRQPGLG